jgi:AcrR family transcriptional regulator
VFGISFPVLLNILCSIIKGWMEMDLKDSRVRTADAGSPDSPAARLSRRERRRLHTRAEILDAARELLLEVGPEDLSLRQVARRADFSPAALYTYFASRDELIAALFADCFERLDAYVRRVPADLPPDRRVVELGLAYMEFARDNPVDLRCMLLSTSMELPPSSGKAVGQGLARLIGETFREGMEQGVFRPPIPLTPQEMAYGVWALVHGMVTIAGVDLSEVAAEVSADPRRVLEAFVALLTGRR